MKFRMLDAGNHPVDPASVSSYTITDDNGYFILPPSVNADGTLSLALSPAGLAAGSPANLYEHLTITVDGHTYRMQVVVNSTGDLESAYDTLVLTGTRADFDSRYESWLKDLYSGKGTPGWQDPSIEQIDISGSMNDVPGWLQALCDDHGITRCYEGFDLSGLDWTSGMTAGDDVFGSLGTSLSSQVLGLGNGDEKATLNEVSHSLVHMGDGDDILTVSKFTDVTGGSLLHGGTGMDNTLHMNGDEALSISQMSGTIKGFEVLDLTGGSGTSLCMDGLLSWLEPDAKLDGGSLATSLPHRAVSATRIF